LQINALWYAHVDILLVNRRGVSVADTYQRRQMERQHKKNSRFMEVDMITARHVAGAERRRFFLKFAASVYGCVLGRRRLNDRRRWTVRAATYVFERMPEIANSQ